MGVTLLVNAVNILLDYMLIFGRWGAPRLGDFRRRHRHRQRPGLNLLIYALIARRFIGFSRGRQGILVKIKEQLLFSLPFLGQEAMEDILFVVGLNMLIAEWERFLCPPTIFWDRSSPLYRCPCSATDRRPPP